MGSFLRVIGFMTILPVPARSRRIEPDDVPGMVALFPVAGLVTGLVATVVYFVFISILESAGFAAPVAGIAAVAAIAIATGGIHLDGVADSFDGLYGPSTPAKRLAAMKDHNLGAFGAMALFIVLAAKLALVSPLVRYDPDLGYIGIAGGSAGLAAFPASAALLMASGAAGRWMMVVAASVGPYARRGEGLGKWFVEFAGLQEVVLGAAIPAVPLAFALSWLKRGVLWTVPIMVVFLAAGLLWGRLCRRRINGQTGDTLGAAVELGEVLALFILYAVAF